MPPDLLQVSDSGLLCQLGGFHVDPWRPVPLAVITHAHGDHARPGSGRYIAARPGIGLLKRRLSPEAILQPVEYGERVRLGDVTVSLHPAGHVLGSAQVRVETGDSVWVVSGDYKRDADPTCSPFELLTCDVFITEATFALPIYRWRPVPEVVGEIVEWWQGNAAEGKASVLFCYALGKAQRVLSELADTAKGPVFVHGTVEPLVRAYRDEGVRLAETQWVSEAGEDGDARPKRKKAARSFAGELVIAPPAAAGTPWMRRFGAGPEFDTGFASGWMQVRGIRRRRGYDRGFVLSDHADWQELLRTVQETGAKRVLTTHGYSEALARHLQSQGIAAEVLPTQYGEEDD